MISFLLQEGVITIGTLSGIFTALLLNSLKNNIIDPFVEKVAPIDKFVNAEQLVPTVVATPNGQQKDKCDANTSNATFVFGNQFGCNGKPIIKWKVFLRDFITWLIIITLLYLIWKKFIHPYKLKSGLIPPQQANIPFFQMGMGKKT
jgi:hypothetical protein